MKLKTFLHYLDEMEDENQDSSLLYFVNERGEYFGISDFDEDDKVITLELGEEAYCEISCLAEDLSAFAPSSEVRAYDPIEDITYSIEGGWDIDEDGDVYMDIHESRQPEFSPTAQEEYGNTDTSNYVSLYEESGFFEKLAKFATRLGVKTVYLALWLYYAAKHVSVTNSAIIIGALGYLMCPIDLIADILPIVGFSDDAAILLTAFNSILKVLSSEQIEEINRLANVSLGKYFKDFSEDNFTLDQL